jgi:hypothetical protein
MSKFDTDLPANRYLELVVNRAPADDQTITISKNASIKVNRNGSLTVNRNDIVANIEEPINNNARSNEYHDYLDTEAKRRYRDVLRESITPELRAECPGLVVVVLSRAELDIMMDALREKSENKRKLARSRHQVPTTN